MTYDILATGSSGNCVIINGEIAIDMGISMKKLRESGYIKDLRLVLLTHRHTDHFNAATVRALHKERPILKFGCCDWMIWRDKEKGIPGPLLEAGVDKKAIHIYSTTKNHCAMYGRFAVKPVKLVHDVPNCGYKLHLFDESGSRVFYATDTGTLDGIEAKNYDLYMIEANHTSAEIEARIAEKQARGEFSYEYRAAQNHLSREQALEWLVNNISPERWNSTEIVFLHQHKEEKDG